MGSTLPMLPVRSTWSRWHSVLIGLLAVYLVAIAVDVIFTHSNSSTAAQLSVNLPTVTKASVPMPSIASSSSSTTPQAMHLIDVRRAYAKIAQDSLLESNANAVVWTSGDTQQELHMRYPQKARTMARQLEDETIMFQELRQLGFTRVELTDGNSFNQHWELN